MKFQVIDGRLILRDTPGCLWLFALFFIVIGGVFTIGPGLFFSDREVTPWYIKIVAAVFGLSAVGAGLLVVYQSPRTTSVFDTMAGALVVSERGLRRESKRQYPMREIAGVRVAESRDTDGDRVYRLQVTLRSGDAVDLTQIWSAGQQDFEKAGRAVADYLGLPSQFPD